MHSKSDNMENIINDKTNEVIEELSQSLFSKYQIRIEISIKGCDFIFDYMDTLDYKCHKIILKRVALNLDSFDWIKNKRATKNPEKNYNNCFQYPA